PPADAVERLPRPIAASVRAMRTAVSSLAILLLATASGRAEGASPPVDTFGELSRAIIACWNPPAGSERSEITLRFGLTGHGALRGPPMVTWSKLVGPPDLQQAFA